jgi:uncharacterized protein
MSQDLKYSRITALRPRTDVAKPAGSAATEERHARLARLLDAELRATARGCHLAVTRRFSAPARCDIGPQAHRLLAPRSGGDVTDTSRWIFLDTETTGLSGGTGTYAFLVGLAWWEADELIVEQLFMRDHSEEASLLLDLSRRLAERPVLVTFNGKSFDWPLLETRYRMTRTAAVAGLSAHIDLLHPSRQLWRLRLKSVALAEVEREVLRLDRGADIPSHTIPGIYFDFLRGGPEEPIVDVFRHNEADLQGLAMLATHVVRLLEGPEKGGGDAGELYGVSRMLQRRGDEVLAREGYQRALVFGLPAQADRIARRELALMAKRQGDYARANELWESLLDDSLDGIQAYEQLAIYYEHQAHNRERASSLTREALGRLLEGHRAGRLNPNQVHRWHDAFRRRLARLDQERLDRGRPARK